MRIARTAAICAALVAVAAVLISGGSDSDPRTPAALPGLPPPFLGTAVSGDGGVTAALDAYGDVVDLRAAGPAGRASIENPSSRQAAGTVPTDTGVVPRVRIGEGPALPMWRADAVTQRYLRGTNVVRTVARFGATRVVMTAAASGGSLAMTVRTRFVATPARSTDAGRTRPRPIPSLSLDVGGALRCARERRAALADLICKLGRPVPPDPGVAVRDDVHRASAAVIDSAGSQARHWLARSLPLGSGDRASSRPSIPPAWARAMYRRSLLTIHALTSARSGAVAAGAREGWAYVWPRDAATAALALEAAGHRAEARAVARFLTALDLSAAARFDEAGAPVPGRAAQGDALGWVAVAARATGVPPPNESLPWRDRSDYQESSPGTYLANALAATATNPSHPRVDGPKTRQVGRFSARQHRAVVEGRRVAREFGSELGLERRAGNPGSGLDSAAGWAVRPFRLAALYPDAERTLLRLARHGTRYGITPGEGWAGGDDPWTAPTAWSAWALAGLGDRGAALGLLADLRRASTPAGDLPERVGARTGIPTSTTPLLWSSAFAVLALRELWR